MNKLYLAYGSNLNVPQMKNRCLDAEVVGTTVIPDYCLAFWGNARSCGVLTIEHFPGGSVPVVIWQISEEDERHLDFYEGYPHLYDKETFTVEFDGRRLQAMAYVMTHGHRYAPPTDSYLRTCADGYDYFGFDTNLLYDAAAFAKLYAGKFIAKKPVVEYESRGESGNVFWLLAAVHTALRREHRPTDYNTCRDAVLASHSYDEALSIMSRYVTLVDRSK